MFAGKTTELIRRLAAARAEQPLTVAIKPVRDTRYALEELVTHAGERVCAVATPSAAEIPVAVGNAMVIGIDEAHFFGPELTEVCVKLVESGRRVIVSGLEFDHRGDVFEPFPGLLTKADETTRLTAICTLCGGEAIHSQRLVASDERIAVGGVGDYEPRCAQCFKPGSHS